MRAARKQPPLTLPVHMPSCACAAQQIPVRSHWSSTEQQSQILATVTIQPRKYGNHATIVLMRINTTCNDARHRAGTLLKRSCSLTRLRPPPGSSSKEMPSSFLLFIRSVHCGCHSFTQCLQPFAPLCSPRLASPRCCAVLCCQPSPLIPQFKTHDCAAHQPLHPPYFLPTSSSTRAYIIMTVISISGSQRLISLSGSQQPTGPNQSILSGVVGLPAALWQHREGGVRSKGVDEALHAARQHLDLMRTHACMMGAAGG